MNLHPDSERHLTVTRQFLDAGYERLALINAGPDVDGFLDFAREQLIPRIRRS
jgi:hypothetical protein